VYKIVKSVFTIVRVLTLRKSIRVFEITAITETEVSKYRF